MTRQPNRKRSGNILAAALAIIAVAAAVIARFAFVYDLPAVEDAYPAVLARDVPDEVFENAVQRLAKFLTFKTVSDAANVEHHVSDAKAFDDALQWLTREYDHVLQHVDFEKVAEHSMLFTWRGSNETLKPLLFIAHYDVVPAVDESAWTYPPFSGELHDGYIWGRGSMDVKGVVIALLEATQQLLSTGFKPQRTLVLAFGHDEEVGGKLGARRVAALLSERYGNLEAVIDEGSPVVLDGVPFAKMPVALVATAEKGYVSFEVNTTGDGGHASLPPAAGKTAVSRLARIVAALDTAPLPPMVPTAVVDFMRAIAPHAPPVARGLLANCGTWPVNVLLANALARGAATLSVLVRTTSAVTSMHAGGIAGNVIPNHASMTINFRTLPNHDTAAVTAYLNRTAAAVGAPATFRPLVEGFYAEPSNVLALRSHSTLCCDMLCCPCHAGPCCVALG